MKKFNKKELKRQSIIKTYIELAYKLGKLPSSREMHKFGTSRDAVSYNFETHNTLKDAALKFEPSLEKLETPATLTISDIDSYRVSLEKKGTVKDNKLLTESANTLDYVAQFADKVFSGRVALIKSPKSNKKIDRVITLMLTDLHIGADVKKEETGALDFGKIEESRRLAHIIKETINYKKEHRDNTKLKVFLGGDLIHGSLHDPRDAATVSEQFCRALHILIQALAQLANNFSQVEVECQSGNHDRITSRHPTRAVNQKWDSFSTMLYYSLKSALSNAKNVSFNIPKTPYSIWEIFGQKVFATHGDTVVKPGYPGSAINTKSLENQLNKINASLLDKEEIKLMMVGHVHTASTTYLNNGCVMLTNGALVPVDEFAVSIGLLESQAGQMIYESVPGFVMGDSRFIRVGKEQDLDTTLDNIIKPWVGFDV